MPPFTGVAVKFTTAPAQTVVDEADILTDAVTLCVIVTVIALEVTVGFVTQPAVEVITQVMTSPLFSDELLKVALLPPVLFPFTFHW